MANEGEDFTINEQSQAQLPPVSVENIVSGLNKANSTLTTISNKITSNTKAVNTSANAIDAGFKANADSLIEIKNTLSKNNEKILDSIYKLIDESKKVKEPAKPKEQEEKLSVKEVDRGLLRAIRDLIRSKITPNAFKEKEFEEAKTEKKQYGWLGNEIKGLISDLSLLRKQTKAQTKAAEQEVEVKTEKVEPVSPGTATVANIDKNIIGTENVNAEKKQSAGEAALDVPVPGRIASKPIEISIVDINDEVLQKLTKVLGSAKKEEKEEEPKKEEQKDRGLIGDILNFASSSKGRATRRLVSKKAGDILTKGRGALGRVGGSIARGASKLFSGSTGRILGQVAGKAALPLAIAGTGYEVYQASKAGMAAYEAKKQSEKSGREADIAESRLKAARQEKLDAEMSAKAAGKTTFTFRGKEFKVGEPNKLVEAPGTITKTIVPKPSETATAQIKAKPATDTTQIEVPNVTAAPAVTAPKLEPTKTEKPVTPSTVITPVESGVVAPITKQPENQIQQQITATLPPELIATLNRLAGILSTKKEDNSTINSGVTNTNNSSTIINMYGGGDDIGSSRSKTDKKLTYYRGLA